MFVARLRLILMLVAVAVWGSAASAQSPPPPRDDRQIWNETLIIKPLGPKRDLIFIGILRLGQGAKRPVEERAGIGLAFKVTPHLTIMPTYHHVEFQPFPNRYIHEERLVLNITGKASLGKFNFTDRNLLERRVRHNTADFTIYRNRLQIDHPMQIGRFKFRGFVADEFFYTTQSDGVRRGGWYRNRISAGIIKQLTDRLQGEFFFLQQHDGFTRPGNYPAFGTLFRYTL